MNHSTNGRQDDANALIAFVRGEGSPDDQAKMARDVRVNIHAIHTRQGNRILVMR